MGLRASDELPSLGRQPNAPPDNSIWSRQNPYREKKK